MDRKAIAAVLEEMALLLELAGENPFKIRAYENAARAVLTFPGDLEEAALRGELARIKGIGKSLSGVITELALQGQASLHQELRGKIPPGLLDLLQVPGLGPKKARLLFEKLQITGLGELEYAIRENRLAGLPGFGLKTQEKLRAGLESVKRYAGLFRLGDLWPAGQGLAAALRQIPGIVRAELAGEARRALGVASRLDVVVAADNPEQALAALARAPCFIGLERQGAGVISALHPLGIPVQITLTKPPTFGAALLAATGSPAHYQTLQARAGDQGLDLTAQGLYQGEALLPSEEEEDLYRGLGLPYIAPELRENLGEIEAAAANRLPRLITPEDVRGCCHVHSYFSDGVNSLAELTAAARARGWSFLGLSDHSQSAYYAGGLKPADLERQRREIARHRRDHPDFSLFWGIESDILADGSLDYGDDILAGFDFVIASVHSQFGLPQEEMTRRIVRAMENPHCTMVGHVTGRLLLAREAYAVDLEAVLEAAARLQVIMELNSSPYRLDLDWQWLRRARDLGLLISLNPDAHNLEGLGDVDYGVMTARKGWLTPADVLNTHAPGEVSRLLRRRLS
jgi:DNA polymerase (family 10)